MLNKNPLDAVIISACRTPIGKIRGILLTKRPDDLLAHVFREAVKRAKIDHLALDEAFAGCANQAGEDNRNVARMAVLLAGLGQQLPAVTVNRLCASGLEAIVQASRAIKLGDQRAVLAGGVESMSRAPWVVAKPTLGWPTGTPDMFDTSLGWRFPNSNLAKLFPLETMGETAENLAEKFQISRLEQDNFAFASHQKALTAQQSGFFSQEICPVTLTQGKVSSVCEQDEGPRADTSLEQLAKLKPAFRDGGSVTAGNSSSLNDGAAALVITSREFANTHGLTIRARIVSSASAGVDPRFMGIGPVPATQKLLSKTGIKITDIDAIELNEAFAAQALSVIRELRFPKEKVNQNGGAIALGHPLGSSGARIITTLLHILERKNQTLGLATLCVGVGQGLSMLIERE